MKPVVQSVSSVVLSVVASVVASWLLRRLLLLTEQPEGADAEGRGTNNSPVVVIMPIIMSGNTIGNTFPKRQGKFLRVLAHGGRHRLR